MAFGEGEDRDLVRFTPAERVAIKLQDLWIEVRDAVLKIQDMAKDGRLTKDAAIHELDRWVRFAGGIKDRL